MASIFNDYQIGSARSDELVELGRIEAEAAAVFPRADLSQELREDAHEFSFFEEACALGRLWVARQLVPPQPVGFAVAELVDESAHLSEMDVHPVHSRKGLGKALVSEVIDWANASGFLSLTLTTFRHLPWNGPFYASLGFVEIEAEGQGPGLRAILLEEADEGLDPSNRLAMRLDLTDA